MPSQTPTKIQAALKLDEMPVAKWRRVAHRSFIGSIFFALGIFLLWLMYRHHVGSGQISLSLLLAGVAFASFGAHIFSGQIFGASVVALAEPLRVLREFWRGRDQ